MHALAAAIWIGIVSAACPLQDGGAQPEEIDPFGKRDRTRSDAIPGFLELSDKTVHPGRLYLTRDARLKIYDEEQERHREVPLRVIRQIDCEVKKEWMEKEWRFKENANDEKVYTGRKYPAREYLHVITLSDGRKITGPLSGIVYVQPEAKASAAKPSERRPAAREPQRFLLHKRQKGEVDTTLKALTYVQTIQLGEEALEEGERRARQPTPTTRKSSKAKTSSRKRTP